MHGYNRGEIKEILSDDVCFVHSCNKMDQLHQANVSLSSTCAWSVLATCSIHHQQPTVSHSFLKTAGTGMKMKLKRKLELE
jgi:hypothetical protein